MNIHLICVGQNMPDWVQSGFQEYARRMPRHCGLKLVEIPASPRKAKADLKRIAVAEGEKLLAAVPRHARKIALTREGRSLGTRELAKHLRGWIDDSDDVALLVGGPEGLSDDVLGQVDWSWSLSPLTFAHPLVRVVVTEQLYRAHSVLENKPYHRGD